MPTDEKSEADLIVVGVIKQLIARVEEFETTIKGRQETFEKNLFDQFVALRKDIYDSYLDLKLKYDKHDDKHLIDDQRKETDALTRAHRQFTLNILFAGVFLVLIIGFVVIGVIIFLVRR